MTVGTLRWAEQTGGWLRAADRLQLAAQIVATRVDVMSSRARRRSGLASPQAVRADVERMREPETDAARAAAALCLDVSSNPVANHCFRTYLWSRILALRDDVEPDDELLYVACVLHDLGLTERFWSSGNVHCFSIEGADAAGQLLRTHWPADRVDKAREAIILHMNVRISARHGVEARLLTAATGLDVTGFGLRKIDRATAGAVVRRYPRDGMGTEFASWIAREASHRPQSRMAYLDEKVALGRRAQVAPF